MQISNTIFRKKCFFFAKICVYQKKVVPLHVKIECARFLDELFMFL